MRLSRKRVELIVVWIVTVFVPMVYILMLPGLSSVDPFGTGPFSASSLSTDMSISSHLRTPQANGAFAAFTSPTIVYLWINPIARRGWTVRVGSFFFTFGWLFSILLPLDFATSMAHGLAFATGMFGMLFVAIGFLLVVAFSPWLWAWFSVLVVCDLIACTSYNTDVVFLIAEYLTALVTSSFAPLVNTIGRPGRPWPRVRLVC